MENELNNVFFAELLDIYGHLLPSSQQSILDDYFNFDLSLSEIAENRNISRSGVLDAVKKGKKKLEQYEEEIGMYKLKNELRKEIDKLKEENAPKDIIERLERMIK